MLKRNTWVISSSVVVLLCLLVASSCKKKNTVQIPNVFVDLYIYTSDPEFANLHAIGGWIYVTGGSRGIFITRTTPTDFAAFERHCPYQPDDICGQAEVDSTTAITLIDRCCGSTFLMSDGSVLSGPTTAPLRPYFTSFDGTVLRITN